jgi:hypothetical protein
MRIMNARWLAVLLFGSLIPAAASQTVSSFEGIDASQVPSPEYAVDANGAVGTKQYMEYTNVYFQAYDKVTYAPVWSTPQSATSPWQKNGIQTCNNIVNDVMIIFDRLASRWVIAGHTTAANNYNFCIAISSTDDLTSSSLAWYTYVFPLDSVLGKNPEGQVYFPDWPKIATWPNGYYVAIDLNDMSQSYREVGILVCAFDRTDMLNNSAALAPICLEQMSSPVTAIYLAHSLIPADVEGTNPPPAGRDEFFTSIQNPPLDSGLVTSTSINLWDFYVDWTNPSASTLTQTSIPVSAYQPGCYTVGNPVNTVCVPEPSTSETNNYIDSVGDRFMPRMSYRNFGSYESFVVSHTVQPVSGDKQTGIRWYELRGTGSGLPSLYQDGVVTFDDGTFRFMPSIAEDASGNAGVGYNISSSTLHPGMNASYFSLISSSTPTELTLFEGEGDEENTYHMGSYSSMTVDPVNGCTFWYLAQYFPTNQTGPPKWGSRVSNFSLPSCGSVAVSPGSLSFGSQTVGVASNPQNVTLTNDQNGVLNITSITFTGTNPGDFSQTNNCGTSLNAGASCTISVTFTPGGSGSRSALLNVNDNAPNTPQTAALSGTGVGPVTLSASSVSFGQILVGGSSTAKPVILTNNQNVPLTNISILVSGSSAFSQVNNCGTSVPANGQCSIVVTFSPQTAGTQTGTVTITDSAINSPQTISLSGSAVQPISLSPSTLNFGTQAVGTSSPGKNIVVTNHEKVAVTFSSIAITGADRSDFSQTNTCTSVAPGGTCTVTVVFTPSVTGSLSAVLKLTDSATNSPQTASLLGTGD